VQQYIRVMDGINNIVKYLVSLLFIIMVTLVAIQVLTRFVIDYPISWTEEIARFLMIYIVMLGSSLLVRKNGHIAVDFLLEIVSANTKKKIELINIVICGIFFIIFAYCGIELTIAVISQVSPTLQFSMALAYAAIPIGAILMILNAISIFYETIFNDDNKKEGDIV
jgi:TRAP-type C4-dicarboxylate transport system permease small subunit